MMNKSLTALYDRITQLPRKEIVQWARSYEARAAQVGKRCRNNIAGAMAIKLRIYLDRRQRK